MKIGLIRHAVTSWNTAGKLQGQLDVPLNEEGRKQARLLAARFTDSKWDVIVSSDLQRAKSTADAVAEVMGLPVVTDKRLRELHLGRLEGTTIDERISQWGESWTTLDHGMESAASVEERIRSFLADAEKAWTGQSILVVSHGMTIGKMIQHLLVSEEEIAVGNTSLSIFEKKEEKWKPSLMNCTVHLDKELRE